MVTEDLWHLVVVNYGIIKNNIVAIKVWAEQTNEVLDLFSLTINLFISHHVDTSSRSLFIELVTSLTVTLEQYKVVSSTCSQHTSCKIMMMYQEQQNAQDGSLWKSLCVLEDDNSITVLLRITTSI